MRKFLLFACMFFIVLAVNAQSRLDQMIAPGFHPVTFEDPRVNNELRPIYVYHKLDNKFVTEGGDVQVYALQARFAVTDDLAIIATKDGYVDFNPNANVPEDTGWANIEAGLKYAFFKDTEAGHIGSLQLRYEFPWGDEEVFQGQGDGIIHPSVSGAFSLTPEITFMTGTGLRIPVDNDDSFFWDFDAQVDYRIDFCDWSLHPLLGTSLIHVVSDGKRLGIADEGQDFFNFGASEATGENIVTAIGGLRAKFGSGIEAGVSYQVPYNSSTGNRVIDHRWTSDLVFRF